MSTSTSSETSNFETRIWILVYDESLSLTFKKRNNFSRGKLVNLVSLRRPRDIRYNIPRYYFVTKLTKRVGSLAGCESGFMVARVAPDNALACIAVPLGFQPALSCHHNA